MSDYIKDYKERISRTGTNIGESLNSNTIEFNNINFINSPTYRLVEVHRYNEPIKTMDTRVIEIERLGSLREIILRPNDSLDIGTYIKFDGFTWLLFDKYGGTDSTSIKMLAIKCNRTIKWLDKEGTLHSYDCVASATDLGSKSKQSKNEIEWNKYDVRLPLGQLFITLEANPHTNNIDLNNRFIFGRNVYEVTGIDDITGISSDDYGIIQLTVKIDIKREKDDFNNGIAENLYKESEVIPDEEEKKGGMLW